MIRQFRIVLSYLFLLAGTLGVLSVVRVSAPELPVGIMEGQVRYIARLLPFFTVSVLLAWILSPGKKTILSFSGIVGYSLILLGGLEAILGLKQVYGYAWSNHSLFKLTGSFFNPGPYSGYLALVFPLALHEYLKRNEQKRLGWRFRILCYLSGAVALLIACLLPSGMSRSAWVAAIVSGGWVYGVHCSWGEKIRLYREKHKKRFLGVVALSVLTLFLGASSLFLFKKDSASGRLLMWKISVQAIVEKPLTGYGAGSFPAVYGDSQERYFAEGNYTEREELVAGSPEYAFNEYLQITMEWGVPVLIAGLLFIGYCLYVGYKKGRVGICGAILSLLVFSFSSYPFQLPVFVITLIFLLMACLSGRSHIHLLIFALLMGGAGIYLAKRHTYNECLQWSRARTLYQVGSYQAAKEAYESLYPKLRKKGTFLFEYGHCLHRLEAHEASNSVLQEAVRQSCDPMILNVIGKNHQALGNYEEAERWLLRSTHRLPGRIYPYYLLAKLYAEPEFNRSDQLEEVAVVVLTKEPKVQSTAVRQMREEVRVLLSKKNGFCLEKIENR